MMKRRRADIVRVFRCRGASIGDAVRATIADAGHIVSDQEPDAVNRAVLPILGDRG